MNIDWEKINKIIKDNELAVQRYYLIRTRSYGKPEGDDWKIAVAGLIQDIREIEYESEGYCQGLSEED